jgi:hypothetical protein
MFDTAELEGALADPEFLRGLVRLVADPQTISGGILQLRAEGERIRAAQAAHDEREKYIAQREFDAVAKERAAAAKMVEADARIAAATEVATEQERQAQVHIQRAENAKAMLAELRADMKAKMAA